MADDEERFYATVWQFMAVNTVGAVLISMLANFLAAMVAGLMYDSRSDMSPEWTETLLPMATGIAGMLLLMAMNFWFVHQAKIDLVHAPVRWLMLLYTLLIPVSTFLAGTYIPVLGAINYLRPLLAG